MVSIVTLFLLADLLTDYVHHGSSFTLVINQNFNFYDYCSSYKKKHPTYIILQHSSNENIPSMIRLFYYGDELFCFSYLQIGSTF